MSGIENSRRHEEVSSLDELASKLHRLGSSAPSLDSKERLLRITVAAPGWDVLTWLSIQDSPQKFFWSSRDGMNQFGGFGAAMTFRSADSKQTSFLMNKMRELLNHADPDTRFYGGISFNHRSAIADEWSKFGAASFWLPRFELQRKNDLNSLAINLVLPRDTHLLEDIESLLARASFDRDAILHDIQLPKSDRIGNVPEQDVWTENIEWALDAFEHTDLDKVVLARRSVFNFKESALGIDILQQLRKETSNCFYFLFQADESNSFFGASPERLFRKKDRQMKTEAVAGTRTLTGDPNRDAELASELLTSEKDRREHEYVRISIHEALSPLMDRIEEELDPRVMHLEHHLHLQTSYKGRLKEGHAELDILNALHPTPAVGGYPGELALEVLDRIESFNRGWYAGPVGWLAKDSSEFAVAIRSGLLSSKQLNLYSGAGIVPGSVAEKEWREIENKIGDFLRLLKEA